MSQGSQYGEAVFLRDLAGLSSAQKLKRISFAAGGVGAAYDEAWLQKLIMMQPGLLPIGQIEPAFATIVPVCMELPMHAGFVDNLFVTPQGDIALIECKLWRNPEARRKVVAQIIDYASELTTWNYEKFESAIRQSRLRNEPRDSTFSLFEAVSAAGQTDEVSFHDTVSRNIKRGRFLLLIVGDGIREGLETMTEFLQQHAGLHFTLSIVELALFESPGGGFIAQPRVLARTTNIERGIVTIGDTGPEIKPPNSGAGSKGTRAMSITEERFFELLETSRSGISVKVQAFVVDIADINVLPDFGSNSLTLRWHSDEVANWNLGSIVTSGEVWMDYHGQQARNLNVLDMSKRYLEDIAALVPGAIVKMTKNQTSWNVADSRGRALRIWDLLLDDSRRSGWLRAISRFQTAIAGATAEE